MTPQTPRVLVAASGSLASRQATAVAANLASTFEAQLVILHVVPAVEYRVGRLAPTLPITRQPDDPLTNPVLLEARRLAWTRGTSARTILIAGDPAPVIVAVARELRADLLVIGSTPRLVPARRPECCHSAWGVMPSWRSRERLSSTPSADTSLPSCTPKM